MITNKNSIAFFGYFFLLIGILSFFGFEIFVKYKGWVEVSNFETIVCLTIGTISIVISKKMKKPIEYTKCPECEETYFYNKIENGMYPKCNVKTIDIDKYYGKYN